MAECELPKLDTRVRFPYPAPQSAAIAALFSISTHKKPPNHEHSSIIIIDCKVEVCYHMRSTLRFFGGDLYDK